MVAEFKSQICTTVEQSKRLLGLGLKPETADMYWVNHLDLWMPVMLLYEDRPLDNNDIPAWSLHRLIEMMPKNIAIDGDTAYPLQTQKRSDGKWCVGYQGWYDCVGDLYDSVIWIYQLLISEGYLDEFCNKG